MIVFFNGRWVPENRAVVSVFDRGFLYGDGLFEAIPFYNGKFFRWPLHMKRFRHGAKLLKIAPPFSESAMERFAAVLVKKNKLASGMIRIVLSRGVGVRGYSPKGADRPVLVMSAHSLAKVDPENPPGWRVVTSSVRLPAGEALALFKSCNKLPQVMARAQADAAGAREALLLNTDGFVVEGTASNLFWIRGGKVFTPPLASGILPGTTRATILEICRRLKISAREILPRPAELHRADGVFLTVSSIGVAEIISLDGRRLRHSPLTRQIARAYNEMLAKA